MMSDLCLLCPRWLSRANVHALVNRPRIGRNDLAVKLLSQLNSQRRLPRPRLPDNDNQFIH
jgi:hypothetical protein